MFKIIKYLTKKDWLLLLGTVACIVIQVWLELLMPDFMASITVIVERNGEVGEILLNGVYMALCAFGVFISASAVNYLSAMLAASFSMHVRKKLFTKVEELSLNEINRFSTSSLITRTTNDVTQLQMFLANGARMLVRAPMTAVWAIIKISNKSWQWSAVTGVGVVIVLATVITLMVIVVPRFKLVQKLIDKINGITRENLTGIRVVRAFNAEKYQEEKFAKANNELTEMQIFNQRAFATMSPVMFFVMLGSTLAIYFIGAFLINGAEFASKATIFGDMVVFSTYSTHVIMSFLMLSVTLMIMPRAQVSAERINEVLDAQNSIADGDFAKETELKGEVEFRHVSFKYPDAEEYLLKDISFKAERGQTVAFIGSTGSGKSTLINLVPRFYDATDGEILIDGVNVQDYKQKALRNKIGYVSQRAVLFNGSVKSNVAFGDNGRGKISDEKVREAIKVAQGKDFVEEMEKTYDAHIAQGGTNISGGQKQRLAIARAIARDPEIYIFDDSFSALDYKTDATLRKALKKYTKHATSLIVAQRIGTIMNADQIVVLDKGQCVGIGTHAELMKNCEVYKQIALSQLTKEELNV